MRLTIFGCGTSTGVPVIGCHCQTCSSTDPRNKRTRSSILIQENGKNILIDTSTDLRAQSLANGIERIDAVLFTHPHADHIHGIDDLRAFNLAQGGAIPCYGGEHTIDRIRVMFDYIFREDLNDGWKPNLRTAVIDSAFELFGITVTPVEIQHGPATIFGYRFGNAAYLTDCSGIPEHSLEKLKGVELLIIGALRYKPHPTHFSIQQAIDASAALNPKRTVLTHLGHNIDYGKDNATLPKGVELAYDGLTLQI
ncbi:MAG: MBL fold metallo-hydrolase [Deltaproteobacteria bacterium]|nr:MBL fold metallo-hydrolase [Deltaproteobacteria bacterium]